ncbi:MULTISPECIES: DUF6932 family protein [Deinococcus]|uniref:DUF6932 family protein n=1 Tax=Deinococcus rufus TaxID=2136097 RepID=A0ABV7ZA35_9DEIO|nr:hypothetical protein [Deinococcus sp. AB2017081]WQE95610.1 hypothetical protein U2P90_01655 [Deinococcus sp. AB2017081]
MTSQYPIPAIEVEGIPELDPNGLLPSGIYLVSYLALLEKYQDDAIRSNFLNGLTLYMQSLRSLGCALAVYIDGSFVTSKDRPSDIDIVVELPKSNSHEMIKARALDFWEENRWLIRRSDLIAQRFNLDCHFWEPANQTGGQNDLIDYFQRLRAKDAFDKGLPPDHRKGIVKVAI